MLNDKLVNAYNDKGFWDAFAQHEPFTGIKSVKIENMLQEYRFSNEDLKVDPTVEYKQHGDVASSVPEANGGG